MIKAIILMAGNGTRLGSPLPKQYHFIAGKRLYLHTLESFLQVDHFSEIILVCEQSWQEAVSCEVASYPSVRVIAGGDTRQDSSYLGLSAAGAFTEYVVIHDGVRPFVSQEILLANIQGAKLYGAVDTCIPSSDTIVYAPEKELLSTLKRTVHLRGQTPQSFSYSLILKAHQEAQKRGLREAPDDCSLVLQLGERVFILDGEEENFKITTSYDLQIAKMLLSRKEDQEKCMPLKDF